MKKTIGVFSLVFLVIFKASAVAGPSPNDAKETVKATADQVLSELQARQDELRKDRSKLYDMVYKMIVPQFDFEYMSKLALGKHWRRANEQQQQTFSEEFKKLLVNTYASALLEYVDLQISYYPVKATDNASKVLVKSRIKQPAGEPLPVNYYMRLKETGWKVFDIEVAGVRYINTYRHSFASQIREAGIDGLIDRLLAKNNSLTK